MLVEFDPSSPNAAKVAAANDFEGNNAFVVLKFGSSALRTHDDQVAAVSEIYRYVREGKKVIAVVSVHSAIAGALIAGSAEIRAAPQSPDTPLLDSLDEGPETILLARAFEAVGLDVRILGARALAQKTGDSVTEVQLNSVVKKALNDELKRCDAIVLPCFVEVGEGEGRLSKRCGGSDPSAVFLAAALGLKEVTLVKNVDLVCDRNSGVSVGEGQSPGAENGAVVAPNAEAPSRVLAKNKLSVAIAGLGLIGEGVAIRLGRSNPDYEFRAALVREPFKERNLLDIDQVTNDIAAFLATKPDIIIDALPDGKAGLSLITEALMRGVSVVTANKQAIAGSLSNLTRLANRTGAEFLYSASVGGGAPFVETVKRARNLGEIESIEAVLNGTVNFILSSLANGGGFEEAVKAAQVAGFAEPDPSADLSGGDARAKLAILSFAAFGREIDPNAVEVAALDAEKAARFVRYGGRWKQIARLQSDRDGELLASVTFERCDDDPLFTATMWEANALRICLVGGRIFECRGKGAGRRPTVESILGDLGSIRRMPEPLILRNEALQENAVSV